MSDALSTKLHDVEGDDTKKRYHDSLLLHHSSYAAAAMVNLISLTT